MAISNGNLTPEILGAFTELYEFYDGVKYSRYTSFNEPITFESNDYKPVNITRGKITRSVNIETAKVEVTAPISDQLGRYIANYPVVPTKIRIIRVLVNSPSSQFVVLFNGSIQSIKVSDGFVCTATCVSSNSILDLNWPRNIHSGYCQNVLFDAWCGVDKNACMINLQVQAIGTDGSITSTDIGANGGKFTGGYVLYSGDYRWITFGTTNKFYLHVPFDTSVQIGTIIQAYWGCDGTFSCCRDRFNNLSNFFGCPHIPSDNPVTWGV